MEGSAVSHLSISSSRTGDSSRGLLRRGEDWRIKVWGVGVCDASELSPVPQGRKYVCVCGCVHTPALTHMHTYVCESVSHGCSVYFREPDPCRELTLRHPVPKDSAPSTPPFTVAFPSGHLYFDVLATDLIIKRFFQHRHLCRYRQLMSPVSWSIF
jgi:hypothetical protein